MSTEKNAKDLLGKEEGIDFGKIFRIVLMQSKIVIGIIILFFALSLSYYIFATKTYKITSLVQVMPSNQQNNLGNDLALDLFLGSSNTSDLDIIEDIYKSRTKLLEIIKINKLNFEIKDNDYKQFIDFLELSELPENKKEFLYLKFNEDNFEIFNSEKALINSLPYNKLNSDEKINIQVRKPNNINPKMYEIEYRRPEDIIKKIKNKFQVQSLLSQRNFSQRNSGLLEISYLSQDRKEGVKVLDFANELFLSDNIEVESEQARKAIDFIDQRVLAVESDLRIEKNQLKDFREQNSSVDVELEIQSIIESLNEIESQINSVDIDITKARNTYTSTNPLYLDLLNQKATLISQKDKIESKIKRLPLAQQEYIDLFRNVENTEEVYQQLLSKRLEYSIKEASTLGNIRIVDTAYVEGIVSPRITIIFYSIFVSFFMAIFFAIVRGNYFLPISNPAELADNNVDTSIIGVLPFADDKTTEGDERLANSIESVLVNISTLEKEKDNSLAKKIVITSPTSGNGKSFSCKEIVKKYALLGKKVLLMDCDYKRGTQREAFKLNKFSLNDFRNITEDNIEKLKVEDNLYVLPKISKLTSSFKFIYSLEFENKFRIFEENFDYIVIDTGPILAVSDTSMLLGKADFTVGVVRHGVSKLNEIKQQLKK